MAAETRILQSIAEVPAAAWDGLSCFEPSRATPFVRHAWLSALESSGSAAPASGWSPSHLTLWEGAKLLAAAPAYRVERSDGDFASDVEWSEAAREAGIRYYPKLVLGIPFTPVTGRRLLVAPSEDRAECVGRLLAAAHDQVVQRELGGLQVLFPDPSEVEELAAAGLAIRLDNQYHWRNAGYRTPEEFLARFPSKRRNAMRRERAAPEKQGIAIRTVRWPELASDPIGWARQVFALHRESVDRMTWGQRWVNGSFYERVLSSMPEQIELVEARRSGELVAVAFNVASPTRLYGRYWGARESIPFLHFNVCLYHSIDECIRRGVEVFEGGAGGEHKLMRGFEPAETYSAHRYADPRLDHAVRRFLQMETRIRREGLAAWRERAPLFRSSAAPKRA